MKVIRVASLEEYARQFWKRQQHKATNDDHPALKDIRSGGDPIGWLVNLYPYKLPQPYNDCLQQVQIETVSEAEDLLIHQGMPRDTWAVERCLVPCPKTRRLGPMVSVAIERGYFNHDRPDTQVRLYREWQPRRDVSNFIDDTNLPLIEETWAKQFEIVDGWGRLHALLALVRCGKKFVPFNCFMASRSHE